MSGGLGVSSPDAWQLPFSDAQQPSGRDSYQASSNIQRPGQPSQRQPANGSVNRGASLPADVRAGLDAGLQSTHRARVQSLADRLRNHSDLQGDEILAALKQNPATAAHAEARAAEILNEAMAADQRAQLQNYTHQLGQRDSEFAAMRQRMDDLRAELYRSQDAQRAASEKATREAAQRSQAEAQAQALRRDMEFAQKDLQDARADKLAAEKALIAAQTRAESLESSVSTRAMELEQSRDYYKAMCERKDQDMRSLERALQQQLADAGQKSAHLGERELVLASEQNHAREQLSAATSELDVLRLTLEEVRARNDKLERSHSHLKKQKTQLLADLQELEDVLAESEAERKEIRDKYIALGEKVELLLHEEATTRDAAERDSEAARIAVREAVSDLEQVAQERNALAAQLKEVERALEEEQHARRKGKKRLLQRAEGAEKEAADLRQKLEDRSAKLAKASQDLQALAQRAEVQTTACEHKVEQYQARNTQLEREHEHRLAEREALRLEFEHKLDERMRLELKQQELEYEGRIKELEIQIKQYGISEVTVNPQDYISRNEHARVCDSRVSARDSELQAEFSRRIAQLERDSKWKMENREAELVAQSSAKLRQAQEDADVEQKRLQREVDDLEAQVRKLQSAAEDEESRDLHSKEFARLRETIGEVKMLRDEALQAQADAERKLARCEKQLREVSDQLRSAQEEAQEFAVKLAGATADQDKARRLEGEARDLQAAHVHIEQTLQGELRAAKQELEARGTRLAKLEQQVTELQHAQQVAAESGAKISHELEAARSLTEQLTAANKKLTGDSERGAKTAVELVQAEAALQLERDERERLVAQHRSRLNKFGMQVLAQLGGLRQQQALLRMNVEGEVARCSGEVCHQVETLHYRFKQHALAAGLEAANAEKLQVEAQQLRTELLNLNSALLESKAKVSALQQQKAALAAQVEHQETQSHSLQSALTFKEQDWQQKQGTLEETQAALQQVQQESRGLQQQVQQLQDRLATAAAAFAAEAGLSQEVQQGLAALDRRQQGEALQQMRHQVRSFVEQQAVAWVLHPIEQILKTPPAAERDGAHRRDRPSARSLMQQLSSRRGDAAGVPAQVQPSAAFAARVDAAVAELRDRNSRIEELCEDWTKHEALIDKLRQDGRAVAEAAREEVVQPLRREVEAMRQQLEDAKQTYQVEMDEVRQAAEEQISASHSEARAIIDQLQEAAEALQQQVAEQAARAAALEGELAGLKDDAAQYRAARHAQALRQPGTAELDLLKSRVKELEGQEMPQSGGLSIPAVRGGITAAR